MTHSTEDLSTQLASFLGGRVEQPSDFAGAVLRSFASFTQPQIDAPSSTTFEYIKAFKPFEGGVTIKPGNIRLNWRQLFEKAPELVLTGAGVTQPWLIPFAALYLWNLVWSLSKIETTPAQAMTMHALWNVQPATRRFSEVEALAHVNAHVNAYRDTVPAAALSAREFAAVVDDLVKLQCIELADGEVWLREWVKKPN